MKLSRYAFILLAACGSDPIDTSATTTATSSTTTSTTSSPDVTSDTTSETVTVTFALTLPPETAADAVIGIEVDDAPIVGTTAHVPAGAVSWVATNGELVELDANGAVVTHSANVVGGETLSATVLRWGPRAGQSQNDVAFLVQVPADTDSTTGLWIGGSTPELGEWQANGVRLHRAQGDYWAAVVTTSSATLEYKVTRGTWDTVEKGASGEELDNRTVAASAKYQRAAAIVSRWADKVTVVPTGDARIEYVRDWDSQFLDYDRDLIIWLPPGYDAGSTRYPVLYMHDGQNLMDFETSAFGEWYIDETAQSLVTTGEMAPVIIVGVYNTDDRMGEYTPTVDSQYGGGNADNYGKFLVQELKPYIDGHYRTMTDAASTGLAGSSLGGLVSLYLGLEYPGTFGRIGVISPSVWWDDRVIIDDVTALSAKLPLRIWLDIGTDEGGGESVDDTDDLKDALVSEGWVLGGDLAYSVYPGAGHNEAAWAARADDFLRWLYPR